MTYVIGHFQRCVKFYTKKSFIGSARGFYFFLNFRRKRLLWIFFSWRFNVVDVQNAVLAGGVAVGAVADLMIQPYGALLAGVVTGAISTCGYQFVQVYYTKSTVYVDRSSYHQCL